MSILFHSLIFSFCFEEVDPTTAEAEIVRQIKEKCCYVAFNPADEELSTPKETYALPDGSVIEVIYGQEVIYIV